MTFSIKSAKKLLPFLCIGLLALQACNKEFENYDTTPPMINEPATGGTMTLSAIINSDTSFSFLKAAIAKTGLDSILSNPNVRLTLFAPDNAAFRRSLAAIGLPPTEAALDFLDTATLRSIASYHLAPGYLPAESIPTTFPNLQYTTFLNPAPQLSPFLRLTIFPSRRDNGAWVNNIPITAVNTVASNGVLHRVAAVVLPPSKPIYDLVTADTSLSFLAAALSRADSGRTSLADTSLVEIAKSIGVSVTVFVPTNDAFRQFLMANGLPPSPAAFGYFPVTSLRAILAYHVLTVRAFSVNMPTTPTFIKTFLNTNSAAALHPGVNVVAAFTGPFVTSFQVTGVGNSGPATVLAPDIHAYNGVIHKIDRVLLPQ